jgi:hypothetical protein
VSAQQDTGVRFNRTPVSASINEEEDTTKKTPKEDTSSFGGGAPAAPTSPPSDDKPKRRSRSALTGRETVAPDTIELTDVSYTTGQKMGFTRPMVDLELQRFLSKARAKGWLYIDWKEGFRNWLLNEVRYAQQEGREIGQTPRKVGRRSGGQVDGPVDPDLAQFN